MLTEESALELCVQLWTWLAESPGRLKCDFPGFGFVGMLYECPCCEYVYQQTGEKPPMTTLCCYCPLIDFWGPYGCEHLTALGEFQVLRSGFGIDVADLALAAFKGEGGGTAYDKWRVLWDDPDRASWALEIRDAAQARLDLGRLFHI